MVNIISAEHQHVNTAIVQNGVKNKLLNKVNWKLEVHFIHSLLLLRGEVLIRSHRKPCPNHLPCSEGRAAVSTLCPWLPSCHTHTHKHTDTHTLSLLSPSYLLLSSPLVVTPAGGFQWTLSDAELPGAEARSEEKRTNGWIKDHRLASITLFCFQWRKKEFWRRCTWYEVFWERERERVTGYERCSFKKHKNTSKDSSKVSWGKGK